MTKKRNFEDIFSAYLYYCRNHESTKKIQMWSFISVVAGALERKVWLDRGYYTLYPNLYVFIIGKSGMIKKSTSTAMAISFLRELDDIKFMSERLTAASLIQQMGAASKPFAYKGKEVSQSPLFAYSSELAVMMGEVFGSVIELLTTFYDCQPNDPSKPWVYKARHDEPIKVYGPCLNILGASTKEWLHKCIPDREMEGGFASRAIFVVENSLPDRLIAWPKLDQKDEEHRVKLLEDLYIISQLSGEFKVMPLFRDLFEEWYEQHMRRVVAKNEDNRMTGYYSRKGDTILKLSMIRSVSLGNSLELTEDHFKWALREINLLEEGMIEAFNERPNLNKSSKPFGETPIYKEVESYDVMNYLKSNAGSTQQQIANHFGADKKDIANKISDLVGMGLVEVVTKNRAIRYYPGGTAPRGS